MLLRSLGKAYLGEGHDVAILGAGVMPADAAARETLAAQDFLYTVVEQAADALRALDEAVSRTVRSVEGLPTADPGEPADEPRPGAYRGLPEAWR